MNAKLSFSERKEIIDLFKNGMYKDVIFIFNKMNIDFKFFDKDVDSVFAIVAISFFREKRYINAIDISKKISKNYFKTDYLLNEVLGESYYQENNILQAFYYYDEALKIKPTLKSAKYKYLILKKRLNKIVKEKEIDDVLQLAIKNKKTVWIRDLSYLYYSIGNYKKSNRCLETIIELNGNLDLIDQLTFSLKGLDNNRNSCEKLIQGCDVDFFSYELIDKGNQKLVVVVSPHSKFALKGYKFNSSFDILYIGDNTSSYYTYIYKDVVELISNIIEVKGYTELSLVGASKGGTGALMFYQELSNILSIPIRCLAFSPQVRLYPFNTNLVIPSYRRFLSICEINPIAEMFLAKAPKVENIIKRDIDNVTIVYGDGYEMDKREAELISDESGIQKQEIHYSGHATIIPFTIPYGRSFKDLEVTYSSLDKTKDEDFQALGGGQTVDIIDQIWKLYNNPEIDLNNLL